MLLVLLGVACATRVCAGTACSAALAAASQIQKDSSQSAGAIVPRAGDSTVSSMAETGEKKELVSKNDPIIPLAGDDWEHVYEPVRLFLSYETSENAQSENI